MARIKEQRLKILKRFFYKYKVIQKKYISFENFIEDLWNISGYEPYALAKSKLKFFPNEFEFRLKKLKPNHIEKWKKLGAELPMNNNPGYQKIYSCFRNYKNYEMFEWKKISEFIKDYKNIEGYDKVLFFDNLLLLKRKDKNIGWNVKNCYWSFKKNKTEKIRTTDKIKYIFVHMDGTIVEWKKSIALFYKEKENFLGQIAFSCKKRKRKVTLGWRYFSAENWKKIKEIYGTSYYFEAEALYQYLVRNNYCDMEINFEDFLCKLPEIENFDFEKFLKRKGKVVLKENTIKWKLENLTFDTKKIPMHYIRKKTTYKHMNKQDQIFIKKYLSGDERFEYLENRNMNDWILKNKGIFIETIEKLKNQNFNDKFSEAAISYLVANNKTKKVFYKKNKKHLEYIIKISNEILLLGKRKKEKNILNILADCRTKKNIETLKNSLE